jgi:hypothetical protein
MRPMAETTTIEITIAPALDRRGERIVGCFDARISRGERLVHATRTPLYDSAREMLERGLAKATDTIVMRHSGSPHELLRATVGKAARMAGTVPAGRADASNAAGSYFVGERDPRRW